jgi:hypothetical protein
VEKIKDLSHIYDINRLRNEYIGQLEEETKILDRHNQQLNLEEEKSSAQKWLDENFSKNEKKEIKNLNISKKNLQGHLDLSDFVNLERLYCSDNQLTSLNLDSCLKLERISCYRNQLTQLDLSNLNQLLEVQCSNNKLISIKFPHQVKRLIELNVSGNNFLKQDLSIFEKMINLESLLIDNFNQEKIKEGVYNRFTGSLKPLKNLTKLKWLDISSTDVGSGLEYLPESVKYFSCLVDYRKGAKCQKIYSLFANDQGIVETERDP